MSNLLAFPLARNTTASRVAYIARTAWPSEGIFIGDRCVVRPGIARVGQIVAIHYCGDVFFSKLISRDLIGGVTVCGRTGRLAYLQAGQYLIEGVLVR